MPSRSRLAGHCTAAPAGATRPGQWLALGGQLGVAGQGELALEVLGDVEREAADHGDDGHFSYAGHCCDKGHIKIFI